MKFYSEILDEFFDSEKECVEAEFDNERKKAEAEAEEKRRKEAEKRKQFEAEKDLARARLEKKIEALNKEVIEYIKTYEKETPWLADLVEVILEQPSEKKTKETKEEKRPAATPITRNEFVKILEGFLN
jgi:hypothetical protein